MIMVHSSKVAFLFVSFTLAPVSFHKLKEGSALPSLNLQIKLPLYHKGNSTVIFVIGCTSSQPSLLPGCQLSVPYHATLKQGKLWCEDKKDCKEGGKGNGFHQLLFNYSI